MPIANSDLVTRLSINTGPGKSTAQTNPNDSLGRFMSSTAIDEGTILNNLFDDISGDENAASDVEYRCFFCENTHGSLTLQSAVAWVPSEVSGGATVAIGLDTTGNVAATSASPQTVARPADENTAPSGITFSTPTTKGAGLSIGNLASGQCRAVWVRRTAANTSAVNNDGFSFTWEGDSAA